MAAIEKPKNYNNAVKQQEQFIFDKGSRKRENTAIATMTAMTRPDPGQDRSYFFNF
jgi:hypothetical protein